jgi:hypothetical protein
MQSLESIPTWFSDFTDISLEAAQIILSISVILAVLLPTMYLSMRMKTSSHVPTILLFFLTESLLVGIGWLPFWVLIATVAVLALAIASFGTKGVTGG